MEIERKYLVKKVPVDINRFEKQVITQSYISTDPVIRIRRKNDEYILEIKGKGSFEREEYALIITREQYDALKKKTEGNEIVKDRYLIPIGKELTAELDIYKGDLEGMLTVEVEFKTAEEGTIFEPPEWFGADVTYDKCYKNSYLAIFGAPSPLEAL